MLDAGGSGNVRLDHVARAHEAIVAQGDSRQSQVTKPVCSADKCRSTIHWGRLPICHHCCRRSCGLEWMGWEWDGMWRRGRRAIRELFVLAAPLTFISISPIWPLPNLNPENGPLNRGVKFYVAEPIARERASDPFSFSPSGRLWG